MRGLQEKLQKLWQETQDFVNKKQSKLESKLELLKQNKTLLEKQKQFNLEHIAFCESFWPVTSRFRCEMTHALQVLHEHMKHQQEQLMDLILQEQQLQLYKLIVREQMAWQHQK